MSTRAGGDEVVGRFPAPTTLEAGTVTSEVRPVELRRTVATDRSDRLRWGPIWAGAVVAVATYLLLEAILLAVEALDAGLPGGGLPDGFALSIAAAAAAFFAGGLVAGASFPRRDSGDGLLHGVVVWAAGILAFLLLAALTARLALGSLGYLVDHLDLADTAAGSGEGDGLRDAAAASAVLLGVTLVASAGGSAIGSKLWPRRRDDALHLRPEASPEQVHGGAR